MNFNDFFLPLWFFLDPFHIPVLYRAPNFLPFRQEGPRFPLSTENYVLGLADLAGELARSATMAAAAGNREVPVRLLGVLQNFSAAFQLLDSVKCRDLGRKLQALRQSVCKVERLCYSLHVRGEEALPTHLVAAVNDADDSGQE